MMTITYRLILLVILFLATTIAGCKPSVAATIVQFINADGTKSPEIEVEIAADEPARQLGLMYRRELDETRGMLFIFPKEEIRNFWMKNTFLELDMIFINSAREVVSIEERAVPQSIQTRRSTLPAVYVVEVRGGLARKWGVASGSRMAVSGPPLPTPN